MCFLDVKAQFWAKLFDFLFFINSFKFRVKRCESKSTLKVDENGFQWEWKWTGWIFTTSEVEFVMGLSPALLTARAAFPQHQLAQSPYVPPLGTLSSSQEWDFFFFSSNYLDDPCPNLVYLAAETDLDESQHLVPLSSLSQSPSPMGWKVVVTNTHWICSFLQMLRGISHDIMDFDYNHRNAGITRTRPDHKAACSSFPSPNAL